MPEFVEKWSDIGTSTKPTDRRLVEARIKEVYRAAGKTDPEVYAWFKSPLLGASAYLALLELSQAKSRGWEAYGESLNLTTSLRTARSLQTVRAVVDQAVFSLLATEMADIVRLRVSDLVDAKVCDAVLEDLPEAVSGDAWKSVEEALSNRVAGPIWSAIRQRVLANLPRLATLVFRQGIGRETPIDLHCILDYLSEVCGLENLRFEGEKTGSCVWWPFEKICVLTEGYTELHRDEGYMLHNDRGPSVSYADSWNIYCLHGITVEPWLITDPQRITMQTIMGERNPSIRGILLNVYGIGRFTRDTGIEVLPLSRYPECASSIEFRAQRRVAAFLGRGGSPHPLYLVRNLN
jgi:hypothetical protein